VSVPTPDQRPKPAALYTIAPEVREILIRLRSAYAALIETIPDGGRSAIQVERALKLNKKLAWQVYRVATAEDPLSSGARAPGEAAARQVIQAARAQGVASEITERIQTATRDFHDAIDRHADDRSSFDLMLQSLTGDGLDARDYDLKRTAYRANRELLGKYCEVDVSTLIVCKAEDDDHAHMCSLRGLAGLHRLRPHARLQISRQRYRRSGTQIVASEPLDQEAAIGDPPVAILKEFSSVDTTTLGHASATTCFLADVARSMLIGHDPVLNEPRSIDNLHEVATPARLLLHDMLVDERIVGDIRPQLRIITRRADADTWPGDDASIVLPIREHVQDLGSGLARAAVSELAAYPQMLKHIVDKLGWDASSMRLYRTAIEYPVLCSMVWMRFEPDAP
jgi:hypothetical protein